MAATVAVLKQGKQSSLNSNVYLGTIAFDSSYPTGGEAIDLTGNERIDFLFAQSTSGYVFSWDVANQKLIAYYADNNNAADGVLIQVPDTTDLSAVTGVRFLAYGA